MMTLGTMLCSHQGPRTAPGAEVTYQEAIDKNQGALDAGEGLVPAPDNPDPWKDILRMTGNPLHVIDPLKLPVDPSTCEPIYPNQYLHVNTIFEVAHRHHLLTAWSDKHPAQLVLSGPSGEGVDDYFTPEINSSANQTAPTDPSQPDWTTDNLKTQQYDSYKVKAVINWINGHSHDGSGNPGTPAIFGLNFQSDPRVPDVIGIAQYGVVYTGKKGKIAEHGGDHLEDRNVPILIVWPGAPRGTAVTAPVETTQIAPTILELLGLDPNELQAVRIEQTSPLF